jgi:tetratricopeptide (TPR) repeat protein
MNQLRFSRRTIALLAAAVLALPCAAQERAASRGLGGATTGVLESAIDAVQHEQYAAARGVLATLEQRGLSPFERSRVEQILFNIAYGEGRFDEAHRHLQRAIDVGGLSEQEVAQARYQRAQLFMTQERWADGAAALEAWLTTTTHAQASAYYLLAVAYYQLDDPVKALSAARLAIGRHEQPQESWLSLLTALQLQQEQYEDAAQSLNQLVTVAPNKKTYWLQLSSVYGKLEDYASSLAIMQLAYSSGMLTESHEILRLADLLLHGNLPLRAAEILEREMAAGTVAREERSYSKLAISWIAAAEFDRAIEPLERQGELAATGAPFVRLGEVHVQREDWSAAEAALGRAIAKGGLEEPAEAQLLLGIALYQQGRRAEAQGWFEQSRMAPRHREVSEGYLGLIANERPPPPRF